MRIWLSLALLWVWGTNAIANDAFENDVRPLLARHCIGCHGPDKQKGGLRLDTKVGWQNGGDSGPAIQPGDPDASLVIKAIHGKDGFQRMPPKGHLSSREEAILVKWIKDGALDPRDGKPKKLVGGTSAEVRKWWAFQPIKRSDPPKSEFSNPIDAFIAAKFAPQKLTLSPAADKRTLIRRTTFDLIGLPPTPAEVESFLEDKSPDAFAKVVDRLLQSPHYGECWGRHWLDVVRYADTAGDTADYPLPEAWRYRNYVIDAFNADKPYDQFLREQIAGDILARKGPKERYAEQVTATGYLALSRRFGFDSENYHHLTIQDSIDTLGQSVLGLTTGCARCHDHKYDPITMRDYYSLYGIFASSRYAFPGSEQKTRHRAMAALVPMEESQAKWRDLQLGFASLGLVPGSVLRSLDDMDGDFEMQRAAAGGSYGVLVPPWHYEGKVAVTQAAQSPFRHLHPFGTVGASVASGTGAYTIRQALHSPHMRGVVHVNVEFRAAANDRLAHGQHRFILGRLGHAPTVEVLISKDRLTIPGGTESLVIPLQKPGEWHCLQLSLNLETGTFTGSVGVPGNTTTITGKPLAGEWKSGINFLALDSRGRPRDLLPALDIDNMGVQSEPIPPVSVMPPVRPGTITDTPIPPPDGPEKRADEASRIKHAAKIKALSQQVEQGRTEMETRRRELEARLANGPVALAYGVSEGTPQNARLQIRGEPEQLGEEVPRGFVRFLGNAELPAAEGSGRLELAQWLTRPENPLTARVMVNRIWYHHFGRGLVKTPNDFGTRSEPPTHPELLDFLAARFVRSEWSVKAMHRLILLSKTWQQAGVTTDTKPGAVTAYAAFPRRRLRAEEIRDSILAVSGALDSTPGKAHPFPPAHTWGYTQHAPFSAVYDHDKRSVYLMVQRIKRHPFLALFDGADPNSSTAERRVTTAPTQALYFLNDPFVHAKSFKFAERLLAASTDERQQIELAVRLAFGRLPTADERAEAIEFLATYRVELKASGSKSPSTAALAAYARTLLGSNEFLHCD